MIINSIPGDAASQNPRRALWRRPRPWIGLAVTLTWLGFAALALRHETFNGGAGLRHMGLSREVVLAKWADLDQWTSIERDGKWIGASHLRIRRAGLESRAAPLASDAGFELNTRTRLSLPVMGILVPIDVQARARLNLDFEMLSLVSVARVAGRDVRVDGFVENGMFYYRAWPCGGAGAKRADSPAAALMGLFFDGACGSAPLSGPIVLDSVIAPILGRSESFKKGAEWSTRVSNPIFGQLEMPIQVKVAGRESIAIEGKPRQAWKLIERVGGMLVTEWQDDLGQPLRTETGNGLRMSLAGPQSVKAREPQMSQDLPMSGEPDRAWIREHQDSALKGKPLPMLAKPIPAM